MALTAKRITQIVSEEIFLSEKIAETVSRITDESLEKLAIKLVGAFDAAGYEAKVSRWNGSLNRIVVDVKRPASDMRLPVKRQRDKLAQIMTLAGWSFRGVSPAGMKNSDGDRTFEKDGVVVLLGVPSRGDAGIYFPDPQHDPDIT